MYIYMYIYIYIYIYIYTHTYIHIGPTDKAARHGRRHLLRSVFEISNLFLRPRPWQFEIRDSTDKQAT